MSRKIQLLDLCAEMEIAARNSAVESPGEWRIGLSDPTHDRTSVVRDVGVIVASGQPADIAHVVTVQPIVILELTRKIRQLVDAIGMHDGGREDHVDRIGALEIEVP